MPNSDIETEAPHSPWQRLRRLSRLSIPSAGEMLLGMLVGLVNTYLIGHLGAASLTGVGLGVQWTMASMVLFSAVSTGATALTARMIGAQDTLGASRVVGQALAIAFACGLLSSVLLVSFAEPAMILMGARDESLLQGALYMRIVSAVFPASALMFVGNACLRGAGDTRTPLLVMAAVNVAVAWVLVEGIGPFPQLGVQGAALGSAVGRGLGGLLVVIFLLRGRAVAALAGYRTRDSLANPARRPAGLIGSVDLSHRHARLGPHGRLPWHHRLCRSPDCTQRGVDLLHARLGFAMAATTLVGQGLGAQDHERAEKDALLCFGIAAIFMSVMGVVFFLAAPQIMGLFTDEAAVISMGNTPLRLIGIVQPFLAAMMVFGGSLRGAGDTLTPLLVNGAAVWLLRVPGT